MPQTTPDGCCASPSPPPHGPRRQPPSQPPPNLDPPSRHRRTPRGIGSGGIRPAPRSSRWTAAHLGGVQWRRGKAHGGLKPPPVPTVEGRRGSSSPGPPSPTPMTATTTSPAWTPPSPSTPRTPTPTPTASHLAHQAYLLWWRPGKSSDPGEIRPWTSSRVCSLAPGGDAVQLQIRRRSMASLRA